MGGFQGCAILGCFVLFCGFLGDFALILAYFGWFRGILGYFGCFQLRYWGFSGILGCFGVLWGVSGGLGTWGGFAFFVLGWVELDLGFCVGLRCGFRLLFVFET